MKLAFALGPLLLAAAISAEGQYRSPFAGYRPFDPREPLEDWRKANERVEASGGHIGLMRHGSKPAQAAPAPERPAQGPPPVPPRAAGHSGHAGHGGQAEPKEGKK